MWTQGLGQPLPRPVDPGLHRPQRNPARLGNLPVGHSGHLLQHERFPLVVGKPPERRFHFGAAAQIFLRLGASGLLARVSGRARHFEEPPLPARPAERVVGGANRDPAEPGPHGSLAAVAGCPPEGAQVGLLGGVFGFGAVPEDGEGDGTDPDLATADEFIEGAEVSLFTEPAEQRALFRVLPGPLVSDWVNRRMVLLFGSKTRRTYRFVRVGHEWPAV